MYCESYRDAPGRGKVSSSKIHSIVGFILRSMKLSLTGEGFQSIEAAAHILPFYGVVKNTRRLPNYQRLITQCMANAKVAGGELRSPMLA